MLWKNFKEKKKKIPFVVSYPILLYCKEMQLDPLAANAMLPSLVR